MLHNTESLPGVAATSMPGLFYAALVFLFDKPVSWWASMAALVFTLLQIFFLLRDRLKKRTTRRRTAKGGDDV